MDTYFSRFQSLCLRILSQSDNCQESQRAFRSAKSVPELVTAWQFYWNGVLHEVPDQVLAAFDRYYPEYRDDIARAGIYYNEAPFPASPSSTPDTSPSSTPDSSPSSTSSISSSLPLPVPPSMVLVGDGDTPLIIEGRHRVYVIGNTPVTCVGHCSVFVVSDRASVTLLGRCRCNAEAGTITVRDRSVFNGKGIVTCHDAATVFLSGGTLDDHGHLDISAYGDSVVSSFTRHRIVLHDRATLSIPG